MVKQSLTPNETKKIARLANLKLTEEEIGKFTTQLSAILEYIKKLQEVDTSTVPETSQVTGLVNVKKDDIVDEKRYIGKGDFYMVDAVLE